MGKGYFCGGLGGPPEKVFCTLSTLEFIPYYFGIVFIHFLSGQIFDQRGESNIENLLKKTLFFTKHEIKYSVYICY